MVEMLPVDRENAFWAGVENARRFFMGEADVQCALERLARVLDDKGIPYAIVGALALNEWGYRRVTVGVDVLLTPDGLRTLKAEVLGSGYVEKFPGSRGLRETVAGVDSMFCLPASIRETASRSRWRFPTRPKSPFGAGAWRYYHLRS